MTVDYPKGASVDDFGNLTHDIEGRPLGARWIVGRRMVDGDEQAFSSAELNALAEATTGKGAKNVASRAIGGDWGRYIVERQRHSNRVLDRAILLNRNLTAAQAPKVPAHEIGHAIDEISGKISTTGLSDELRRIYNDLNNPQNHGKLFGPEQNGYKGIDVRDELVTEAIRAYLSDQNYIKTIAPKTAATIRAAINSDPKLSQIIQFNSLAPLAGITALADSIPLIPPAAPIDELDSDPRSILLRYIQEGR